jgi:hypothetical protein
MPPKCNDKKQHLLKMSNFCVYPLRDVAGKNGEKNDLILFYFLALLGRRPPNNHE